MNPIQKAYQHIQMDNQSKKEVLQDILSSQPKQKRINDRYKMITLSCCICIAFICFILFMPKKPNTANPSTQPSKQNQTNTNSELYSLPSEISLEDMKTYPFYIRVHQDDYHQELLTQFLNHIENQENASLIIVQYTIEGDPILLDVQYQNNKVTIFYDATRDKYGVDSKITKQEFKSLGIYENTLYAYNDLLNQDTINNNQAYYIIDIQQK